LILRDVAAIDNRAGAGSRPNLRPYLVWTSPPGFFIRVRHRRG
jgi:hypothetical protein